MWLVGAGQLAYGRGRSRGLTVQDFFPIFSASAVFNVMMKLKLLLFYLNIVNITLWRLLSHHTVCYIYIYVNILLMLGIEA